MPRVTVLVPTRNRPALLQQAVASVAGQTHEDCELIIVDDGSIPPVDSSILSAAGRIDSTLLRHEVAVGQATSRERAGVHATGDFILHLDDDDLLTPELISRGLRAVEDQPDLDVLFFNVEGFGERGEAFDRSQAQALQRLLSRAGVGAERTGVLCLGPSLFAALLHGVPMAFQRPMARATAWREVMALRRVAYGERHPLAPPLRESEWSLYAAATQNTALVMEPLYRQRCDGQGFFSIPAQGQAAERALADIFRHLDQMSRRPPLSRWRKDVVVAIARRHFDQAYACFHHGERRPALCHLVHAIRLDPRPVYLRFALRMLLPPNGRQEAR